MPQGVQEQSLLSHWLWPLSAGVVCCSAWEDTAPGGTCYENTSCPWPAGASNWMTVLSPDPPRSRKVAGTEGKEELEPSIPPCGGIFYLGPCNPFHCCFEQFLLDLLGAGQTKSFALEEDFSAGVKGINIHRSKSCYTL